MFDENLYKIYAAKYKAIDVETKWGSDSSQS